MGADEMYEACKKGDLEVIKGHVVWLSGNEIIWSLEYGHTNILEWFWSMVKDLDPGRVLREVDEWFRGASEEEKRHDTYWKQPGDINVTRVPRPLLNDWLVGSRAYRDPRVFVHDSATGRAMAINGFCGIVPMRWDVFWYLMPYQVMVMPAPEYWAELYWYYRHCTGDGPRMATYIRNNVPGVIERSPYAEEPKLPVKPETLAEIRRLLS
jgi:hypothetical protein